MKRSIFMDKKLLIPAILVTGLIVTYFVATPVLAVIGNKMMGNSTTSKITGSVNVADAIKNFTKDNQKVPFSAASATAEKQVTNGKVLGGHIGIAQGYLVYTFFVVNPENQTGYKVIVDPGNGQVLYTSEGNALGSFGHGGPGMFGYGGHGMFGHGGPGMFGYGGHGMFGHGGPGMFGHDGAKWMRHGFNGFGGSGDERGPGQ
jgi:hypothetical protein